MNTFEAILTRRSIRKYISKPVPDAILNQLLQAAMFAPSARNYRPWQFIVVSNRSALDKLSEVHPYAYMLKQVSLAILVCGDRHLEKEDGYLAINCAASIQNILLAAHELGLGSVWLGVYPRGERMADMKKLFELPDHILPVGLVAIGYADEQKPVPERFEPQKVHYEKWET
ncbi:MAG: nitroreductase family protein [Bacteroidales bacterium]